MFCCVRQIKLPINKSYKPLKYVCLRTQPHTKIQHRKGIIPVYSKSDNPSGVRRSVEHVSFRLEEVSKQDVILFTSLCTRESIEANARFLSIQFRDDLQQTKFQFLNHMPKEVEQKIESDSNSSYNIKNQLRYSTIGNNVMVLTEVEENTKDTVLCTLNELQRLRSVLPDFQKTHCSSVQQSGGGQPMRNENSSGLPTEEQLLRIQESLVANLPRFFHTSHNFSIYHQNVIFYDNITRVTTQGLQAYRSRLLVIQSLANLKYFKVQMHVLKITHHSEDGTVRVRWRVSGFPFWKALTMFWKIINFDQKENEWIDGFSVFNVGPDGLIFKHTCDKVMPDENVQKVVIGPLGVTL